MDLPLIYHDNVPYRNDGEYSAIEGTASGAAKVSIPERGGGEDRENDVTKVHERLAYTTELDGATNTVVIPTSCYVSHISISCNATGAATITVRDSATAGSGTVVKTIYIIANAAGHNDTVWFKHDFSTGLELDFAGKADSIRIQVSAVPLAL